MWLCVLGRVRHLVESGLGLFSGKNTEPKVSGSCGVVACVGVRLRGEKNMLQTYSLMVLNHVVVFVGVVGGTCRTTWHLPTR